LVCKQASLFFSFPLSVSRSYQPFKSILLEVLYIEHSSICYKTFYEIFFGLSSKIFENVLCIFTFELDNRGHGRQMSIFRSTKELRIQGVEILCVNSVNRSSLS
jgi:hypothetical protein